MRGRSLDFGAGRAGVSLGRMGGMDHGGVGKRAPKARDNFEGFKTF
jgi:hypothetical protein